MEKFILYYPFEYEPDLRYGSGVRMANILQAFKEFAEDNNLELIFIKGSQSERNKCIKELKRMDPSKIVGCYIEMPNLPLIFTNNNRVPTHPLVDLKLMNYCKKNNIPLGGFVRDLHWRFEEYRVEGLKNRFLDAFREYYLFLYKRKFDIMFLPSLSMNKFINFNSNNVVALPSGANENFSLKENSTSFLKQDVSMIYVGSIHDSTNILKVLEAVDNINLNKNLLKFNIVCREKEYLEQKNNFRKYENKSWLSVFHLDSNELSHIYSNSDFAIMPHQKSTYHDFAMPVKLMEYLSYGLPILATDMYEVNNFILNGQYGIVTKSHVEDLQASILKMIEKIEKGEFSKEEIYKSFITKNKWYNRSEKVFLELKKMKTYKKEKLL